jgi:hypothetical protein
LNCLSCGRGDANYAPLIPNVKGRDGKYYKGDVGLTQPRTASPNLAEFDRYDTGAEVFGMDTHEQHHHLHEHHRPMSRGSMSQEELKLNHMKHAPLNVVLGMETSSPGKKGSRVNLSPIKASPRPKSAKK